MERIFWTPLFFFANEAWFYFSGYVNSQKSRVCSATNSREIKDTQLHNQKVGVWCAISRNLISTPYSSVTLSILNVTVK
jgi:hypothetical protein